MDSNGLYYRYENFYMDFQIDVGQMIYVQMIYVHITGDYRLEMIRDPMIINEIYAQMFGQISHSYQ